MNDVHGGVSRLWSILLQHAAPSCCCLLCWVMLRLHARSERDHAAVRWKADIRRAMSMSRCSREKVQQQCGVRDAYTLRSLTILH
jgi:hypothetical protein